MRGDKEALRILLKDLAELIPAAKARELMQGYREQRSIALVVQRVSTDKFIYMAGFADSGKALKSTPRM